MCYGYKVNEILYLPSLWLRLDFPPDPYLDPPPDSDPPPDPFLDHPSDPDPDPFPNIPPDPFLSPPPHEEQFKAQEEEEENTRRNPRCKQQRLPYLRSTR